MTNEQVMDSAIAGYQVSFKNDIISLESDKAIIEYEFNQFWVYAKTESGSYEYVDQFEHYGDALDQASAL